MAGDRNDVSCDLESLSVCSFCRHWTLIKKIDVYMIFDENLKKKRNFWVKSIITLSFCFFRWQFDDFSHTVVISLWTLKILYYFTTNNCVDSWQRNWQSKQIQSVRALTLYYVPHFVQHHLKVAFTFVTSWWQIESKM